MNKLKPCPFCENSQPELVEIKLSGFFYVHCKRCGAQQYCGTSQEDIVDTWNMRAKGESKPLPTNSNEEMT